MRTGGGTSAARGTRHALARKTSIHVGPRGFWPSVFECNFFCAVGQEDRSNRRMTRIQGEKGEKERRSRKPNEINCRPAQFPPFFPYAESRRELYLRQNRTKRSRTLSLKGVNPPINPTHFHHLLRAYLMQVRMAVQPTHL